MHNKPSVSVSRDRPFRNTAKIGHDRPKQAVTPYRNDRSRLTEMGGHDGPKYARVAEDKGQSLQAALIDAMNLYLRNAGAHPIIDIGTSARSAESP